MSIFNLLKSKAYKQGFQSGKAVENGIDNPYADEATMDNINNGMGASPWWDTRYKPFIDWEHGRIDGRQKDVDAYLNRVLGDD